MCFDILTRGLDSGLRARTIGKAIIEIMTPEVKKSARSLVQLGDIGDIPRAVSLLILRARVKGNGRNR